MKVWNAVSIRIPRGRNEFVGAHVHGPIQNARLVLQIRAAVYVGVGTIADIPTVADLVGQMAADYRTARQALTSPA